MNIKRKKVILANTTYRFYTHEGWTRKDVAEYIASKNIFFVIPRWFDNEMDNTIPVSAKILENTEEYSNCDYFAIYHLGEEAKINETKLSNEHDIDR
jgi:hypothetical protein